MSRPSDPFKSVQDLIDRAEHVIQELRRALRAAKVIYEVVAALIEWLKRFLPGQRPGLVTPVLQHR